MKLMEKNVMRLAAVQQLRSAYGIKTKNWNKNKAASCKSTTSNSMKVFGVQLESLPYYNMECGSVPSFLVDACMKLLAHVDTEGLFRKSGSVVRLKALRGKVDAGEECLSTALPCDVAGLVKQFFRELPEPVLSQELQEAFLKAQQLPSEEDRTAATMLLSCVLPERNLTTLRHFFDFLHAVSERSAENKMDSSNLSVILAPNLLHFGDGTEKMNANTEKRLKLQAAVVHCFIENAQSFGVLPHFLQEKVSAMMGCEAGVLSPSHDELEELDVNTGMKRRNRRSFGDIVGGALNKIKTNRTPTKAPQSDSLVFSSATPVIVTPSSKRKLPLESGHSFGFSNKKRRSVKKNLGIDLLPNALFSGTSTPGSAYSASGVLDSSQATMSPAGKSRRQSVTSVRRKSRRLSGRHAVNRVESGKAGCFSPKVSKKDAPRKSLRLRFSLGKSSKDAGSESIGWRLATQKSDASFRFAKETEFSPSLLPRKAESKSSKYISKSEDNLLTPQCDLSAHQTSWAGETPGGGSFTDTPVVALRKGTFTSEPAVVSSRPPPASSLPMKLCCASSAESLECESSVSEARGPPTPTLRSVERSFTEPEAATEEPHSSEPTENVLPPPETPPVEILASSFPSPQSRPATEQNATFSQMDMVPLTPLHIDSVDFESPVYCNPAAKAETSIHDGSMVGESGQQVERLNCSRLIDALDIQSPAHFTVGVSYGPQSTPYKPEELHTPPPKHGTEEVEVHEEDKTKGAEQRSLRPGDLESEKRRVADHIHHFNKLTLHSPGGARAAQIRSPLKFQRTPVRQTVRRMNSLLGDAKRPSRYAQPASEGGPVVKALSLESGLSPRPQPCGTLTRSKKLPPPVPPKKPSTLARKASALGDVTNKVQPKNKADSSDPDPATVAQKQVAQQAIEKSMNHYRGSPRNPLLEGRLLSATKPIDL